MDDLQHRIGSEILNGLVVSYSRSEYGVENDRRAHQRYKAAISVAFKKEIRYTVGGDTQKYHHKNGKHKLGEENGGKYLSAFL